MNFTEATPKKAGMEYLMTLKKLGSLEAVLSCTILNTTRSLQIRNMVYSVGHIAGKNTTKYFSKTYDCEKREVYKIWITGSEMQTSDRLAVAGSTALPFSSYRNSALILGSRCFYVGPYWKFRAVICTLTKRELREMNFPQRIRWWERSEKTQF